MDAYLQLHLAGLYSSEPRVRHASLLALYHHQDTGGFASFLGPYYHHDSFNSNKNKIIIEWPWSMSLRPWIFTSWQHFERWLTVLHGQGSLNGSVPTGLLYAHGLLHANQTRVHIQSIWVPAPLIQMEENTESMKQSTNMEITACETMTVMAHVMLELINSHDQPVYWHDLIEIQLQPLHSVNDFLEANLSGAQVDRWRIVFQRHHPWPTIPTLLFQVGVEWCTQELKLYLKNQMSEILFDPSSFFSVLPWLNHETWIRDWFIRILEWLVLD